MTELAQGAIPGTEEPLVDVALPVALRRAFTYRVPAALASTAVPGARVAVSFHGRKLAGVILGPASPPPPSVRLQPIAGVLDDRPIFPPALLALLCEAAEYYLHPIGAVLAAATPALDARSLAGLKKQGFLERTGELKGKRVRAREAIWARLLGPIEGLRGERQRAVATLLEARTEISLEELGKLVPGSAAAVRALRKRGLVALEARAAVDPFFEPIAATEAPLEPTPAQREAIEALTLALERTSPGTFLLHGVTGSGKTEVYLQVIAEVLRRGRSAIVLVPEIALTPQLVGRFRARFGDGIAVLHSALHEGERKAAWSRLRSGEVKLAIGARSAIFAPLEDVGVIVVDEEHDPSYKQEEGFRYQGRDLAILRAHRAGALAILGSATPSLESFQLARAGKHRLLALPSRPGARPLPPVSIVDLSRTGAGPTREPLLSLPLHRALEATLGRGEQAVLFLNRRGFAPSMHCAACGHVEGCPACSVALVLHRRVGLMRCHYCDYATPLGSACQKCRAVALEPVGLGTEKLVEIVAGAFPGARLGRLDRDTAAGAGVEAVLDQARRREIDVLVGTQMVTKGHDLPGVTLVGVILADQSLAFPDFRAGERTFQLLAQVAGRAGRADLAGSVIVQTYQAEHPSIVAAAAHSFSTFAAGELATREELGYPPFGRLVAIRVDSGDEKVAARAAEELASVATRRAEALGGAVEVLGPAPAPIGKVRGRFRYRALLKAKTRGPLRDVASAVLARIEEGLGAARATIDVDPVSML